MIYVETGSTDVYYNFGLENYFATEKRLPGTVFLFWQTTPTLMVGKYQNVVEEIDQSYAAANGIHLVRRMSGGGTIYTDLGGWQFSFIQHKDAKQIEFQQYIQPILAALRSMGVEAVFNGRNDLTIAGRKFSGNAQYRLGDCLVHHGSLLFATDIERMVAATTVDKYKIYSKSIHSVRERVTNIAEHLPRPMDGQMFKKRMVKEILGPEGTQYQVTPEDRARAKELAQEKFSGWDNIYGKNPRFNMERTGRFAGGKMQVKLEVVRGIVEETAIYGDFFATVDAAAIEKTLTHCRYEREAVLQALQAGGLEGAVYGISVQEMADLITG